ncbi:helix-hairpin-helix domain-containing protein [Deinococcus peraridilitoris]|uniref:DNA-directed DNA polymerase n=1 Tax=Deinococcus peraridilitoris (strain DSM 19664 / LMG 22246 / CIP 109416 / KR-200) TaxID=937777 RepID=K9ZX66_DEIPD|nr:helix-hairpin-helix domain-containing protein [Deinococcus peraridilitoris]AFZ66151.1 DNA polymerase IV (family X) [Deinococcus peraridilitoris DSM 19664]
MDKKQVVSVLKGTADVLELLGEDPFRVKAFAAAARSFEALEEPFEDVVERGFRGVRGIGATLGAELREYAVSGQLPSFEAAAALVPPGVLSLFRVRGLGPKKIQALWRSGVSSLEELREACLDGRVAALKGFGAKSQTAILENVEFALRAQGRQHLSTACTVAEQLCRSLSGFSPCVAGSLRRGLESAGDVDLTVTGERDAVRSALDGLVSDLRHAPHPAWQGEVNGVPVEVGYASAETRGALDLMCTGGALRTEVLRHAEQRGFTLDSHGLRREGRLIPTPDEADVFAALEVPFVPPEYREEEHQRYGIDQLPPAEELLRSEDILGLLHTHSTWSDGTASLREMAEEARRVTQGQGYLGTGDHSVSAHYAGGLSIERLREQVREVRELQRAGLPILAGAEVDILEDGSLDYPDEVLADLDYVVASVHSYFQLDAARQTERLVRAVSHPLVTILGHPTGRLLLRRPPYELDLDAVLQAASERGTVVEINANPYRLDLDWREVLRWRGRLQFAINTDAHVLSGLRDSRYGVMVARKAGLRRQDVVNHLSLDAFQAFVKQQRLTRAI